MNAFDRDKISKAGDPAVLHYGDGEFVVMKPGAFVLCAVTGQKIPLEALRYWNPIAQEAYAGPEQALVRWQALNPKK
jgi:hypothetical protein